MSGRRETSVSLNGARYRVVEKSTHIVIYVTRKPDAPYPRESIYWNGRERKTPRMESTIARVLARTQQ